MFGTVLKLRHNELELNEKQLHPLKLNPIEKERTTALKSIE